MRTASGPSIVARALAVAVPVLIGPVLIAPVLMLSVLAAGPALAAPAASAAAAHQGRERFVITSHQAGASRQQARAAGVLSAAGYARILQSGSVRSVARLVFPHGSLRLVTYARTSYVSVPSPATCKFNEVVRGNYAIRAGAGRYQSASGSGLYITRIVGVLNKERGGTCGSQLTSFFQSTRTHGTLSW